MKEKFDDWNLRKQELNSLENFLLPKRRQVWWCAIGQNIGSEQSCEEGYERPVLVVKVFGSTFWDLIITSSDPTGKKKENSTLYFELDGLTYFNEKGEEKALTGFVSLHQLRIFDARRLKRKILRLENGIFDQIMYRLKNLFR